MKKYIVSWNLSGETVIEASSPAEARTKFDIAHTSEAILSSVSEGSFAQGMEVAEVREEE